MKRLFFLFSIIILSSCSLKYGTAVHDENSVPEFTFSNANYTTYENNVQTMNLKTEKMEQYKGGSATYAKNVHFTICDSDGVLTTKGKCGLLGSNSDEKKYTLFDNIEIENLKDDIKFAKVEWKNRAANRQPHRFGHYPKGKYGYSWQRIFSKRSKPSICFYRSCYWSNKRNPTGRRKS